MISAHGWRALQDAIAETARICETALTHNLPAVGAVVPTPALGVPPARPGGKRGVLPPPPMTLVADDPLRRPKSRAQRLRDVVEDARGMVE
jgi:hypothetical protein